MHLSFEHLAGMKMTNNVEIQEDASAVITHRIKDTHHAKYEAWLNEIVPFAKTYPGHRGVMIIRPVEGALTTYTIVIRFDTRTHLLGWMQSDDRKRLIAKAQPCLIEEDQVQLAEGLDFWFTPESFKPRIPRKWKQSVITWSAIYPLVMGMSLLVGAVDEFFEVNIHLYLKTMIVTAIVVMLMVYIVMPRYTRLVHKWLYK